MGEPNGEDSVPGLASIWDGLGNTDESNGRSGAGLGSGFHCCGKPVFDESGGILLIGGGLSPRLIGGGGIAEGDRGMGSGLNCSLRVEFKADVEG